MIGRLYYSAASDSMLTSRVGQQPMGALLQKKKDLRDLTLDYLETDPHLKELKC